MATCDLTTLKQQACANQFDTLAQTDKVLTRAVRLQLLCNLSSGGIVGSSGQIKFYTADPNTEGVKPDDQTKPAVAYAFAGGGGFFGWNTTTLLWN